MQDINFLQNGSESDLDLLATKDKVEVVATTLRVVGLEWMAKSSEACTSSTGRQGKGSTCPQGSTINVILERAAEVVLQGDFGTDYG